MENIHKSNKIPFVTIFQGRCGSTYVMEALNSHPEIDAQMEIFSTLKKRKLNADRQIEWLRKYFFANETASKAIGFKTKFSDVLDLNKFSNALIESNCRIIHLQRNNLIKLTVSFFNSVRIKESTGDWNIYNEQNKLDSTVINPAIFNDWLVKIQEAADFENKFIKNLGLPTLECYYENLLEDHDAFFERIFDFLEVKHMPVKGNAVKSTSDKLSDAISNYNELKNRYSGTVYESMFTG